MEKKYWYLKNAGKVRKEDRSRRRQSITARPLDFFNFPLPLAKVVVVRKGKIPRFNINDIIDINQGLD